MEGLPLNHQLRDRGGYFVRATRTTPHYRLYMLPGGSPRRPGLLRVTSGGASIDVEVWAIRAADLGSFVESVLEPLGIGKIELGGGAKVLGFLCESSGTKDAVDITASGGWRAYLQASHAL